MKNENPEETDVPRIPRDLKNRIILPWHMRNAIRVRVTGTDEGRTHEYQVVPPFRVGYSKECEIPLSGTEGPATLFEFSPVTRLFRLSTPIRDDVRQQNCQISVDGEPLNGDKLDIETGSVINIRDHDGHREVTLRVDAPEEWSRLLMTFYAVLLVALTALAGYGVYSYQSLKQAKLRIASTEERLTRTESGILVQDERIATTLDLFRSRHLAVDRTLQEIDDVQRVALRELRDEFTARFRDISEQAQRNVSKIASEDIQARNDLALSTQLQIEQLRHDVSEKMFQSFEKLKQAQEEVLLRNAQRLESLELESDVFKSVRANSSDAIVFIRTSYVMEYVTTGDLATVEAIGTGFTVGGNGLSLTPQHVVKPWLYNDSLLSMQSIGLIRILPDTVSYAIWTAQQQVVKPDVEPHEFLTETAFSSSSRDKSVLMLHVPEPVTTTRRISSPFGLVEIQEPIAGRTDLAVLQLIDETQTFSTLELESDMTSVEPLDEVLILGFPLNRLKDGRSIPQAVKGLVRHLTADLLEVDSSLLPGNSGGPVLNREGRVIGMAIATLGSESYGAAIASPDLIAALAGAEAAVITLKQRLLDIGCAPGPLNGQADRQLWQALQNPDCTIPSHTSKTP